MNTHIRPAMDDTMSAPMWSALREHRLILQRCDQCSYIRFPAAELCPECWSRHSIWREIEPAGTIWSYTTYERALHPDLELAVPYTIAFIELDVGPVIPGRIHTDAKTTIAIGARVAGCFSDIDSEFTMLEWDLEEQTTCEKRHTREN